MANKNRGEVTAKFKGKNVVLTLEINEICQLEDELDMSIGEIEVKLKSGNARVKVLRAMFWAMMIKHRPKTTMLEAGDFVQGLGAEAGEKLLSVFEAVFPAPDEPTGKTSAKK